MDKKYLLTAWKGKIYSCLMDGTRAVELHCDPPAAEYVIGNIYIGRIKNIAKNIGAAFVEIAPGLVCHLALDDMKRPVYTKKGSSAQPQSGDELLVQIAREGMKTKLPSVTTRLSLQGKYVLLTAGARKHAASSKLPRNEKERLLALAAEMDAHGGTQEGEPKELTYRWLFRTNAGGTEEELLCRDMQELRSRYEALMAHARYRSCFSCLYEEPAAYLRRLSSLYDSEAEQILTDDERLYREVHDYLAKRQPEDLAKLAFYQDNLLPLRKRYSLETQLEEALRERVWLKSGGYLVIQPTEALTVIDVNTGKFEGAKQREAAFLKINREAAAEIARQLRLRNLSGIIVVDFINMEEEESRRLLLAELDAALRRDPVHTVLVDMTRLSLVEITRQKRERSLAECVGSI